MIERNFVAVKRELEKHRFDARWQRGRSRAVDGSFLCISARSCLLTRSRSRTNLFWLKIDIMKLKLKLVYYY